MEENSPNRTAIHVKVIAIPAFEHVSGCGSAKSSHRPFPFLEAPRTVSPMAPTTERTEMMENAIRFRMRFGGASRLMYLYTDLGINVCELRGGDGCVEVTYKQKMVNRTMMLRENCKASKA